MKFKGIFKKKKKIGECFKAWGTTTFAHEIFEYDINIFTCKTRSIKQQTQQVLSNRRNLKHFSISLGRFQETQDLKKL